MSNEIAVQKAQELNILSVDAVVHQREIIKEIMTRVMKKDVDYGYVPGCPKPCLFKPGAEKLCNTFMLAFDPQIEDLSTADEKRYRTTGRLIHQTTGIVMGSNVGEASTSEDKYKWRKAICDEEFDATEPENRRQKYGKDKNNQVYTIKQIRTNPADLANTVLKMSAKRALVAVVLVVLGASDFFTQDVEDMPAEYISGSGSNGKNDVKTHTPMPESAPEGIQTLRCIISKAFEKKNPKAPQSFGIKGPSGERINGYFQTHDVDMIDNLMSHIAAADIVDITYHVETNGKYTNNVIDDVAASIDTPPATEPHDEDMDDADDHRD